MKPTQEQVIAWARKAGGDDWGLLRDFMPEIERLVILAYEAGRKDENEAIAQMIEDAPPLVDFAKNARNGCLICGFTPELAVETIRARREQ
jgi:hypothetical protein